MTVKAGSFVKYGNFKFYLHSDFGDLIINYQDSLLNQYAIYKESTYLMNFFEIVNDPNLSNISPTSIGSLGGIVSYQADVNLFEAGVNNLAYIGGEYICNFKENNLFATSPNTYECLLFPATYTVSNNLEYHANKYPYTSLATAISKDTSMDLVISEAKIDDQDVNILEINGDGDFTTTPIITSTMNDSGFSIKIKLPLVTGGSEPDIYLIISDKTKKQGSHIPGEDTATDSFYTFSGLSLPSGSVYLRFYIVDQGWANLNSSTNVRIPVTSEVVITNPTDTINSSFTGGMGFTISAKNFMDYSSSDSEVVAATVLTEAQAKLKFYVCGINSEIIAATSKDITIETPRILISSIHENTYILTDDYQDVFDSKYKDLVELFNEGNKRETKLSNARDDNLDTAYDTDSSNDFLGLKIKPDYLLKGFRIYIKHVKIYPGKNMSQNAFVGTELKGLDGTTETIGETTTKVETLLHTNNNNLDVQWTVLDVAEEHEETGFEEIRVYTNADNVDIAEIRFIGKIVNTSSGNINCSIEMEYSNGNMRYVSANNNIVYQVTGYSTITGLAKKTSEDDSGYTLAVSQDKKTFYGTAAGGDFLVYKTSDLQGVTNKSQISVIIWGNTATVTSLNVGTGEIHFTTPAKRTTVTEAIKRRPLLIKLENYGYVYVLDNQIYYYRDKWSSRNTWGGEFVPKNGETVFVENYDIILDVPKLYLNGIFINNGSLFIYDTGDEDYEITLKYLIVNKGDLQIGTSEEPFENRKLTLTFEGTQEDLSLPLFGNKVLGTFEGTVDIHGKLRDPVWTKLGETAAVGDTSITMRRRVDWIEGETFVIASSDFHAGHCEERVITGVTTKTITIEELNEDGVIVTDSTPRTVTVLSFATPLKYAHYGVTEKLTSIGDPVLLDMRAEVGLLNRNVLIQGDKASERTQYGFHQLITASRKNMEKTGLARISYVELFRGGQAFQLGTYPIHFHMLGDNHKSFIKGVSIHHAFNRAITIHATNHLLIQNNFIYNVMGHNIFVEDSVERFNTVEDNLVMWTRVSYSLLNVDFNPASYWITHPTNYYRRNHAAGSETYGFWMEFPHHPTGLHMGLKTCPHQEPLGEFKDNVAHSNGQYGLRIFPIYSPLKSPCDSSGTPESNPAVFENMFVYANKERGFITEEIGDLEFRNFKGVQNLETNLEVSRVLPYKRTPAPEDNQNYPNFPRIIDAVSVGKTNNPAVDHNTPWGIVGPRVDNFLIEGARFYQLDDCPTCGAINTCSRCEVSDAATDSGARTMWTNYLRFEDSIVNRLYQAVPKRQIIGDLDGSFVGNPPSERTSYMGYSDLFNLVPTYWVTQYIEHLDNAINSCSPCEVPSDHFRDTLVCDNTSNQQLRRIAFKDIKERAKGSYSSALKIKGYLGNKVTESDLADTDEENAKWSVYPYRPKTSPPGWAIPLITGCKYILKISNEGIPKEIEKIDLERSRFVIKSFDRPIILAFNYTHSISDYAVKINKKDIANITTSQQFSQFNEIMTQDSETNTEINGYGVSYHDLENKMAYVKISSYDPDSSSLKQANIQQWECPERKTSCPPPRPDDDAPKEEKIWSNPSIWGGTVPRDGDDVEVPMSWELLLDVDTAKLGNLIIRGTLVFDNTKSGLDLKANNILITDTGNLTIGTAEHPFEKPASITLLGNGAKSNIALGSDMPTTFKSLTNLNILNVFGINKAPYTSRLLETIKGEEGEGTSKSIKVSPGLKWQSGEKIVISTTHQFANKTEVFTISSYSSSSGILALDRLPTYTHIGYPEEEILDLDTEPYNIKAKIDERAVVALLTRNIKIQGDEEYSYIGGNLLTGTFVYEEYFTNGTSLINHAEFRNMGRTESETYAAVLFYKTGDENGQHTAVSKLTGISFSENNYIGILVKEAKDIELHDIVMYQPKYYGVKIEKSSYVYGFEIYVFESLNRPKPLVETNMPKIDPNSCFNLCGHPEVTCPEVYWSTTYCLGAETFGYVIGGDSCTTDYTINRNPLTHKLKDRTSMDMTSSSKDPYSQSNNELAFNLASSTLFGGVVWLSETASSCQKQGNYITIKNALVGFSGFPTITGANSEARIENVISVSNEFGVAFNSGVGSAKKATKKIKDVYLIGQTKYSECLQIPGYQAGLILSMSPKKGPMHPIKESKFPLFVKSEDTNWSSTLRIDDLYLINWEDQCQYDSFAIRSNGNSTDSQSITNIYNLYAEKVVGDNLYYSDELNRRTIGEPCGSFPCTGPNTLLIYIDSFKEWKKDVESEVPVFNEKWKTPLDSSRPGSISITTYDIRGDKWYKANDPRLSPNISEEEIIFRKKYFTPNVEGFEFNQNYVKYINIEPRNWILSTIENAMTGFLRDCRDIYTWNAVLCQKTKTCGVLNFEAQDYQAGSVSGLDPNEVAPPIVKVEDLALSPVFVRNDYLGYYNKLNSYLDHGCVVGYPTHKRTPRFHAVVCPEDNVQPYNITFQGATPGLLQFEFIPGHPGLNKKSMYVEIPYEGVRSIKFFNQNKEIVPEEVDGQPACKYSTDCCCSKKRKTTIYTFLITSGENCICKLVEVSSVTIGMGVKFENSSAVYIQDTQKTFKSIISAALGLDSSRVRTTYVIKGADLRRTLQVTTNDPVDADLNFEIMQSDPTAVLSRSGDSSVSVSSEANKLLDLDGLVNNLVGKLSAGELEFPIPVRQVNIQKAGPPSVEAINGDPVDPSTPDNTNTDPINIVITSDDEPSTIATSSSIEESSSEDVETSSSNNATTEDEDEESGIWYWYIILVGVIVIVLMAGLLLYFFVFKTSSLSSNANQSSALYIKNEPHLSQYPHKGEAHSIPTGYKMAAPGNSDVKSQSSGVEVNEIKQIEEKESSYDNVTHKEEDPDKNSSNRMLQENVKDDELIKQMV
eukprot:CAMPEP_0170537490 /NCGR_PEP_ID=MMETSP0209-20121228/102744_1 /TAXON_ID=665100 ORGANISM="Litonotus pictus, Strain P1" /NCGR_SAMPLE_ID=MMETSP0209 /ASSEMBLY_ACC=CAM_ASM_000301 /LENGTH=2876 /DNA_ID=CAMNT_0010838997 /DNA_START=139 /DNA_END=8769 /DNA_ORIENTATION=-